MSASEPNVNSLNIVENDNSDPQEVPLTSPTSAKPSRFSVLKSKIVGNEERQNPSEASRAKSINQRENFYEKNPLSTTLRSKPIQQATPVPQRSSSNSDASSIHQQQSSIQMSTNNNGGTSKGNGSEVATNESGEPISVDQGSSPAAISSQQQQPPQQSQQPSSQDVNMAERPSIENSREAVLPPTIEQSHEEIKQLHEQIRQMREADRRQIPAGSSQDIVQVRHEIETNLRKEYKDKFLFNTQQTDMIRNKYNQLLDEYNNLRAQNADLHQKLAITNDKLMQRERDYAKMESNYLEFLKSIRATDDDLSTIRDKFKTLKYSINKLLIPYNKKADRNAATQLLTSCYPTLELTASTNGQALDNFLIGMLMEKLIMDTLVRDVFNIPLQAGLMINGPYVELKTWIAARNPAWAVRFRQQLCALIANPKDIDTGNAVATQTRLIADSLSKYLKDSYPSFSDDAKVLEIVTKAVKLSLAMRGQDVEIYAINVQEGFDHFDTEKMVMEQKSKPGATLVRFCICPPFVGGDGEFGFLEKGKVFCA